MTVLTFSGGIEEDKFYSYNKTNEMHKFLKFIFRIELYMFWTGFLYCIHSSRYMSYRFC